MHGAPSFMSLPSGQWRDQGIDGRGRSGQGGAMNHPGFLAWADATVAYRLLTEPRHAIKANPNHDPKTGQFSTGTPQQATPKQKAQILAGMNAIRRAVKTRSDVRNAMHRGSDGIGWVDFLWGQPGAGAPDFKGGWGIAKEIAKRSYEHGVDPSDPSAAKTLMALPMVIALGEVKQLRSINPGEIDRKGISFTIKGELYTAVLIKDQKSKNHWLLSGYEVRAARAKASPR